MPHDHMPELFSPLSRRYADGIARALAIETCADRRAELSSLLSCQQLINHPPECFDEQSWSLDLQEDDDEMLDAVRRPRFHAPARSRQGSLTDEVARELITLRDVLNKFLWRDGLAATGGDIRGLSDVRGRANIFIDELIALALLIYAANPRPNVSTRASAWPPPRRCRTDFEKPDER
ncbi:MAG: hypothetical protein ACRD68_16650 [Pyrinomonadaceae bacterium]